jgi:ATP-dependent DNA helicase Rep/DNA helicase-2/ATP-dependent DNA helicase PcrA
MLEEPPAELKQAQREALVDLHLLMIATRAKLHATTVPAELARHCRDLFDQLKLKDHIFEENEDNPTVATRKVENIDGIAQALERYAETPTDAEGEVELAEVKMPGHPLTTFLAQVSLEGGETDDNENERGGVTLITIHGSKGLEWPWVFLVGLEEEILPHKRSVEAGDGSDLSEERRLCYVGITRARERLWMTRASGRKRFGKVVDRTPSRFLDELGDSVERLDGKASSVSEEERDKLADDFFAKMREKLGY